MMAKDTFLNRKLTLNSDGKLIDLTKPTVMAIINLTPDSFFNESRAKHLDDVLKKTESALAEGATFVDLGAYSSRPGAIDISENEELDRLLPAVETVRKNFPAALISIDTFRARVAKEAILTGAHLINDISGGELDEAMFETIAKLKVPYIIMHMKGTPQNMQQQTSYANLMGDIYEYFTQKIDVLRKLGVNDMIIDPGFGFAKTIKQNYQLLQQLPSLHQFELPILVGFSRKSMITKMLNTTAAEALNGTSVLNTAALMKGANILRVHDVKAAVECILLTAQIKNPS